MHVLNFNESESRLKFGSNFLGPGSFTSYEQAMCLTERRRESERYREWTIFSMSLQKGCISTHYDQPTCKAKNNCSPAHVCLPHPEWPKLFEGAITMWKGTLWINVDKRTFLIMRFYSAYIVMKHVFVPVLSISRMFMNVPWFRFSGCCFYIMAPIQVYICQGVWGWIIGELNGNRHVYLS